MFLIGLIDIKANYFSQEMQKGFDVKMRKLSPKVLLILAAVLSVVCGIMIYSYLSKAQPKDEKKNTKAVVIATMDIAPGTVLTDKMVRLELVPNNLAQPDALRTLPDAVGKTIRMPVNSGDQITRKRLNGNGAANTFINSIPKDKRTVTISVDDISGVAGFIRPSTYVDVVLIKGQSNGMPTVGRLVLQKVLVLAVGSTDINSPTSSKKNEPARSLTLALDPREAVQLRVAQQEGKVSFLLRPAKPTEEEFYGATVVGGGGMQQMPAAPAGGGMAKPSANHGVTIIRGTNISR